MVGLHCDCISRTRLDCWYDAVDSFVSSWMSFTRVYRHYGFCMWVTDLEMVCSRSLRYGSRYKPPVWIDDMLVLCCICDDGHWNEFLDGDLHGYLGLSVNYVHPERAREISSGIRSQLVGSWVVVFPSKFVSGALLGLDVDG